MERRFADDVRGQEIDNTAICDPVLNSPVLRDEIDSGGTWACPFFKLDPVKYDECLGKYTFRRIHDVKQHILRRHILTEYHCLNCWEEFSDQTPWKEHTQKYNCRRTPGPEKLSQQECQALKETPLPKGHSDEPKWYSIWQQLFPMHPRPPSPYVESTFCEVVKIHRSHSTSNSKKKLPEILERYGVKLDLNSTLSFINEILTLIHPAPSEIIPARHRQTPPDHQILLDGNPVGESMESFGGLDFSGSVHGSPADQLLYATTNSEPQDEQNSMQLQDSDALSQLSSENPFLTPQSSQGHDWSSYIGETSSSMDPQSERLNRNSVDCQMIDTSLEPTFPQHW